MGLQTVDFNGVSDARFASTNSNAIGTALTAKTTKLSTNLFTLSNSSTSSVVVPNAGQVGYVVIDAVAASGQSSELLAILTDLGLTNGAAFASVVSGLLPVSALSALEDIEILISARETPFRANAGSVVTQADASARADEARALFGVDGAGSAIGVLSDSFDNLNGFAADVASGDLPGNITILDELPASEEGSDEGRAILQLIHDIAPGAGLLFDSAFLGVANFAQGIIDLANAGANIIIDDVVYFSEPFYQDGPIAQAVDLVAANGVLFFSSAGNSGTDSYEATFRNSGVVEGGEFGGFAHDFDPGVGVDTRQLLSLSDGGTLSLSFQYDEPFASSGGLGATSDYDIYLFEAGTDNIVASSLSSNASDALEIIQFTNETGSTQQYEFAIVRFSGNRDNLLKYIDFSGDATFLEYTTNSPTLIGHANANGAIAVGASAFFNTPEFGLNPPRLNGFSSGGSVPILFDTAGNRLATPEDRGGPNFVAPDGGNTTFFGSDVAFDADSFPNFFGTSASAPAAAAIAALLLERVPTATNEQVIQALSDTAIDIGAPGVDLASGAGLIQADAAINRLIQLTSGGTPPGATPQNDTLEGTPAADSIDALAGDDSVLGRDGNDTLLGNDGNDTLRGENGNDLLNGGPGADSLTGDTGDDVLIGGRGNDTLRGFLNNDSLSGGDGDDVLVGNNNDDTLSGDAGNDDLTGGNGNDLLFGGIGNDLINSGTGNDTVDGGLGDDTIRAFSGTDSILGGDGDDSIEALSGADTVDGGTGDDTIIGAAGNDSILGGIGNDSITGDSGDDFIDGGVGNDDVFAGSSSDTVIGGLGNDTLNGGAGFDSIDGGGNDDVIIGQAGNDTIQGGDGDDDIMGDSGEDQIFGGLGNDTVFAGSASDLIDGGAGMDDLAGGALNDTIIGGDQDDTLSGNSGMDSILGGQGNDFISGDAASDFADGGTGNDTLIGISGDDTLIGGDGDDSLVGNEANDSLTGDAGDDTLNGGVGDDFVDGGNGADRIEGGSGDDVLNGGAQNDVITDSSGADTIDGGDGNDNINAGNLADSVMGGAGNDTLDGRVGDDRLDGGTGDDVLTGGPGNDTFIFSGTFGDDLITDFSPGIGSDDVIDLSGVAAITDFADLMANHLTTDPGTGDALITSGFDTIRLVGVAGSDLVSTDFIF
ncbi:MAG: S8 family serine peptidase [Pseudomonadota bacterium]